VVAAGFMKRMTKAAIFVTVLSLLATCFPPFAWIGVGIRHIASKSKWVETRLRESA